MAFLLGMLTGMALLSAFAWIAARMLNEAAGHDEPRLKPNPHLRTESVDARKTG